MDTVNLTAVRNKHTMYIYMYMYILYICIKYYVDY